MYVVMRELDSNSKLFYTVAEILFDPMEAYIRRMGFGFDMKEDAIKKAKLLAKKCNVPFVC